ncbi:MAG: hypothetical protein ACOYYS_13600 [Chloroflexota bacterium]
MTDRLDQAIQLIKAGQKAQARELLLRLLESNPSNENAWLWLTQCLPNDAQRIAALERCLKYNPNSERAQKGLAQLRQRARGQQPPPAPAQTRQPAPPLPPQAWDQPLSSTTRQAPTEAPAETPIARTGSLQSRLARQAETSPAAAPPQPPENIRQEVFTTRPAEAPRQATRQAPRKAAKPVARPKKQRRRLAGCLFALLVLAILGAGGGYAWYQRVFLPQQQAGITVTATAAQPTSTPATPLSLPTLPDTYTPAPSSTPGPTRTHPATAAPGPTSTPLAPATALAQVLPQGPVVLYVAAGACVVKAVSAAASQPLTLTVKPPEKDCLRPRFSPNGKKLAFVLDNGSYELYVMNLNGTGLTKVAETSAFAWSPDSRQLAYHTRHSETLLGALGIVNADGSEARLIGYEGISVCTGCDGDIDISWSPDGRWIYAPADLDFPSSKTITGNIFRVDGSEHRPLGEAEVPFATAAAWSPNGQWLALPSLDGVEEGCNGLDILGLEGEQTPLDATQAHLYGETGAAPTCLWENVLWSPNNANILAYGHPRGDFSPGTVKYDRVLVMTSDGEDVNLLAHWAGHPGASLWSDDGKRIVFVASPDMDSFGSPGPLVIMDYAPEAPTHIILAEAAKNFPGALFWLQSPDLIEPTAAADTPAPDG